MKLLGQTRAQQIHGPGLLVALPYLIDEVVRVPVKRVHELRIDALAGAVRFTAPLDASMTSAARRLRRRVSSRVLSCFGRSSP